MSTREPDVAVWKVTPVNVPAVTLPAESMLAAIVQASIVDAVTLAAIIFGVLMELLAILVTSTARFWSLLVVTARSFSSSVVNPEKEATDEGPAILPKP